MRTQIYLLTPPVIADLDAFAGALQEVVDAVQITVLQIRLKPGEADLVRTVFARLAPIVRGGGGFVLINDDPKLALDLGADGVHLGQSDMGIKEARKLIGRDMVIGSTAHASRHLAMQGGEAGADYVAFGAFYPSATKKTQSVASIDLLIWWSALFEIPCVAIGGIDASNVGPLVKAGAEYVSVCSGIWQAKEGPKAAAISLAKAILEQE